MKPSTHLRCVLLSWTAFGIAGCELATTPPSADGGAPVIACVVGGCSGQLCLDADGEQFGSTCEWREEYACYQSAECTVQDNGKCGWTPTEELVTCLETSQAPTEPTPLENECQRSGCSGQLCIELDADPVATTCEWREEYACYDVAPCEKQSDGKCGWTRTVAFDDCMENAAGAAQ